MQVTVAICTWNRAGTPARSTLSGRWRKLCIPRDVDWELLIVDNNCTDATDEVIRKHVEQRCPFAACLRPPPVSRTRTTGATREARGDLHRLDRR